MLKISNMTWKHDKFPALKALKSYLNTTLAAKLNIKVTCKVEDNTIVFLDVEPGKTFISAKQNKIMLREGDARIKTHGRNYLNTNRPTEKQYLGFFDTIHDTLDELGLDAEVLVSSKKIGEHVIRKGKTRIDNLPKIKSFPVE